MTYQVQSADARDLINTTLVFRFKLGELVALFPDVPINVRQSRLSGNCRSGTLQFMRAFDLPESGKVGDFADILGGKHPDTVRCRWLLAKREGHIHFALAFAITTRLMRDTKFRRFLDAAVSSTEGRIEDILDELGKYLRKNY